MKRLLVIVAFSFALVGFADDQYLYWMVANDAKIDDAGLDAGTYYAKARVGNEGSGSYLNFYNSPSSECVVDNTYTFNYGDAMPMFIGLGDTKSFVIELYNSIAGDATPVGYVSITEALMANHLTAGGMTVVAGGPLAVGSFTAVPEPTSGLLLLLGVAGLALRRKKMQKA